MSDSGSDGTNPQPISPAAEAEGLLASLKLRATEFDSFITSSTASIQKGVDKAKADATEVEKFKTEVATIKGGIETAQQSVNAELGIVTQSKAEIEKLKASAIALSQKLSAEHDAIGKQILTLQEQQKTLQTVLQEITNIKSAAQKDGEAAKVSIKEMDAAKAAFIKLNADTQTQHDALVQKQSALQTKISEIEDANAKVTELRRRLLEDSEAQKSVQSEITGLHNEIDALLKEVSDHRTSAITALTALKQNAEKDRETLAFESKKRFDELHDTLRDRILALLPSAGAAGLSSTYYDAKSRYAPTSFSGKHGVPIAPGWQGWARRLFGYNPASVVATITFYAMFIIPLGYIVYASVQLLSKLEADPHFVLDYRMLVVRFLIVLPLAAISGFGFASLHLYRKLYEEYNHKQRVMELYQSFKDEIDKNGDAEHKKSLLTIMLNSVGSKAWDSAKDATEERPEGWQTLAGLERFIDDITKLKTIIAK
jgi:predicted  nucleic acid-binding Zn-ribbon protein